MRCLANTRKGTRCLNQTSADRDFCSVHSHLSSSSSLIAVGIGAAIGTLIAPGIGGAVVGGLAGEIVRSVAKGNVMAKKRVFVSFDFDNDRVLKDFIVGQGKLPDSPFEIVDHSLKEAAPERHWEIKAKAAILRSEIVLVMVGRNTYRASGVLKEVAMARAASIPVVQIIGYRDGTYTPVPDAGRLYAWNWENLKRLLG